MKRSSRPRTIAELSKSLHQQLNAYTIAAGAAGVGMLALTQPASAKIVYTPVHKNIGHIISLDLNHDGIYDFKFIYSRASEVSTYGFQNSSAKLVVFGLRSGNQIYGQFRNVSALPAGVRIGPNGKFSGRSMMAHVSAVSGKNDAHYGYWAGDGGGVKRCYLGLRFIIEGKVHFGWARLNVIVSPAATIHATLTGYAYETIPNKPIITGRTKGPDEISIEEPNTALTMPTRKLASLGLLAMGAPGPSIWRREQSVGTRR